MCLYIDSTRIASAPLPYLLARIQLLEQDASYSAETEDHHADVVEMSDVISQLADR